MTGTGGPVADLQGIWHRYGKQAALRGVSLDLHTGEIDPPLVSRTPRGKI